MSRAKPLVLMLATALFALVAVPAAQADLTATTKVSGGTVSYDADLGNLFGQDLTVTFAGGRFVFTDSGNQPRALNKADSGCRKDDGLVMSCDGTGVTRMKIETELFDDTINIGDGVTVPVTFSTGQGGDSAKGGPANDTFLGGVAIGLGNDTYDGRGGNDIFQGELQQEVMTGGDGVDTLDYSARFVPQTVSLDDEANDGDPTDLPNLSSASLSGADNAKGIENIIGGSQNDQFTGNDGPNVLDGRSGKDTLEGRLGADTYIGGNGNDTITSRGSTAGVADPDASISCGDGQDTVKADPEDAPAFKDGTCEDIDCAGCEIPTTPGGPSPAPAIAAADPPGGANDADEGTGAGGGGARPDPDGAGPLQPPPPLPPDVRILSGGVVPLKANGRIPVRILCIYRADRCKGSLALKTAQAISARIGGRLKTIRKGTTISSVNLAPIRWGNSAPVQMPASALFRAIVPRLAKARAKVQAILVSQDTAGGANAPTARATGNLTVGAKPLRALRRGR